MSTPVHRLQVAIIGAGLSGLSAALTLLKQGHQVTLYEAAPHAGGRARGVHYAETTLDNGQHLCLGAYHATLELLQSAGVDLEHAFLRLPLTLWMFDGNTQMRLRTPRWLPAPLHLLVGLLTARGLSVQSKWQALRWMTTLQRCRFQLPQDKSVADLLVQGQQTSEIMRRLWNPLCLAALNTPPETASAQIFLNVLRDSLMQRRSDSDFLIARQDLSRTLITPLLTAITRLGGTVYYGHTVHGITPREKNMVLDHAHGQALFDRVIIAVGPHQRKTLRYPVAQTWTAHSTQRFQPITTVYLQFSPALRLPVPHLGLCHTLAPWVFDRGQCCNQPGLLAMVLSAHGPLPDKTTLIATCLQALNTALQAYAIQLPAPRWTKIITEKRATFACDYMAERPTSITPMPHVFLAGDDVDNGYPATIEGTVRNGRQAALLCMQAQS